MNRRSSVIVAFVVALVATAVGWSQVMIYKTPPLFPLAAWFPVVVIAKASDLGAVILSLLQFPIFAAVFAIGIRKWSGKQVAKALGLVYCLFLVMALAIIKRS